jgi:hypothetical protein
MTPTRAGRLADASVDPTEARNNFVGCFGRSDRSAQQLQRREVAFALKLKLKLVPDGQWLSLPVCRTAGLRQLGRAAAR